jgi:hypothetical protein
MVAIGKDYVAVLSTDFDVTHRPVTWRRPAGGCVSASAAHLRAPTARAAAAASLLSTNERGPVERRKAGTRSQAFAAARTLLDVAERREFNRGEVVSVEVRQSDDP